MSDRRRVSPVLSFAWRRREGERAFTLTGHEPIRGRTFPLGEDELWVLDVLDREGGEPRTCEALAEVAARRHALPLAEARRTLARLWPLAFVEEDATPPGLLSSLPVWEHHGCKLPLEYHVSSLGDPGGRAGPRAPAEARDAGPPGPEDIDLPPPSALPATPLDQLLHRRRTCRSFGGRALDAGALSFVLGRALEGGDVPEHLVVHVLALRVDGVPSGVYRYARAPHRLELARAEGAGRLEQEMTEMLIGQTYVAGSAAGLLISGDLDALITARPHPSALRGWLVRVGMLAQRLILLGHAGGVQSFLSAAILSEAASRCTAGAVSGAIVPVHQVVLGHEAAGEPGAG